MNEEVLTYSFNFVNVTQLSYNRVLAQVDRVMVPRVNFTLVVKESHVFGKIEVAIAV